MALPDGLFPLGVLCSFAFLEETPDFWCSEVQDTAVRYQLGDILEISLVYDPYSHEVTMSFSRLGTGEYPYSLSELMNLYGEEFEWGGTLAQVGSPAGIKKVLDSMALIWKQHGDALMDLNSPIFDQLAKERNRSSAQDKLDETIRRAEMVWRDGDYPGLVRLLKPVREQLPGHLLKRLEYAEGRVGTQSSENANQEGGPR